MSGGGKGDDVVVGYWYAMGVHLVACHGPVDEVQEFIIGERSAWKGSITDTTSLYVNKEKLFGGESREGGVKGTIDVLMGKPDQPVNDYLRANISGPIPAYRGLLSFVYRRFRWSSGNPYFKPPWWRVRRATKGWSRNQPWYTSKAVINSLDMNPAHIVYECLTNLEWGMGYPVTSIDDASFRKAADTLHAEGFGLSLMWMEQTSIQDFIQLVLRHFDGLLKTDLQTGRFQLDLLRNDYDIDGAPELNPDNVISLDSFQRSAWGDSANEVVVKYVDRDQKEATVAVQDLASIQAQGGLVSTTRDYPGIRTPELATRVALRDLNNVSVPLAKVSLRTNRVAWDWNIGKVFKLTWPKYGLEGVPFRITEINKGSLAEGEITISAIEDIFGLPDAAYVQPQPPIWEDPIKAPQPVGYARTIEAPYWDVIRGTSAADFEFLPEGWAFGQVLAVEPSGDSYDFRIASSPTNAAYTNVGVGEFSPSAVTTVAIPRDGAALTFTVDNAIDFEELRDNEYFYIDDEAFAYLSSNLATNEVTAQRGVLDTIPAEHASGSRVYFARGRGTDRTVRIEGEQVYYKALTRTGLGELDPALAPALPLQLDGRGHKPYPPGNVKVNGVSLPSDVYGAGISVTWAHRDRLAQTVSLVPHTAGNIGPEIGTEYPVVIKSGAATIYSGVVPGTSWSLPLADDEAAGYPQNLSVELSATRDGEVSWQKYELNIERHGLGFRLGAELGGVE